MIKEALESRERQNLSRLAAFSDATKGRAAPVSPDLLRTEFQRDRDRILHSKALRRLMHKTQVFLCPEDEHYRTRLTHTLEVSQIARTISRSLYLNEDLTEAIALGHDLGHAPFGHAGERVLARVFDKTFTHNKQSLRVVDIIEGLNLTFEVRDGIVNHTGEHTASTLEGVVVRLADRIAYINHDIDDAQRAGILTQNDIPKRLREVLGEGHGERINTMVNSVISCGLLNGIRMEESIQAATDELRAFLFERVYTNPIAKGEEFKADILLERLYCHFRDNATLIPDRYRTADPAAAPERLSADFVCDMTDKYAIAVYESLYIPKLWRGYGGLLS